MQPALALCMVPASYIENSAQKLPHEMKTPPLLRTHALASTCLNGVRNRTRGYAAYSYRMQDTE